MIDPSLLWTLSAHDGAQGVRDGFIGAEQLTEACLARIRELDGQVQAWAFLDEAHARTQARARADERREGQPTGPLHGVPIGVKDVFDTADMPTEDGTPLHAGRTPREDAAVVTMLRAAGAVILGKTVTTELATYAPGKTRNPHDPAHTPGGSSSGSAAAVAAGMVPVALGTQTNASVIRPASFCGVYGFKPSHGLISRRGVLRLSRTLDHVGLFARTIEDVALVAEQIVGYDSADPDTRVRARIPFGAIAAEEPPFPPLLAYVQGPAWHRAEEETREAFAELTETLRACVVMVEMPESAQRALEWHRTIMEAEMAVNLEAEWDRGRHALSDSLREQLARGRDIAAFDYQRACAWIPLLNEAFDGIFERCAAIVTPAAAGTAPRGLASTGDPSFCSLWTLCGMPAISVPLLHGGNGLPLGVQLVGRRGDDARLLRTARWLVERVAAG